MKANHSELGRLAIPKFNPQSCLLIPETIRIPYSNPGKSDVGIAASCSRVLRQPEASIPYELVKLLQ